MAERESSPELSGDLRFAICDLRVPESGSALPHIPCYTLVTAHIPARDCQPLSA